MYKVDPVQQLGLDTRSAPQLVPGFQSPQLLAAEVPEATALALLQVLFHTVSQLAGTTLVPQCPVPLCPR